MRRRVIVTATQGRSHPRPAQDVTVIEEEDYERVIREAPHAGVWDSGWQDDDRWGVVGGCSIGGGLLSVHKSREDADANAAYYNGVPGWDAEVLTMREIME